MLQWLAATVPQEDTPEEIVKRLRIARSDPSHQKAGVLSLPSQGLQPTSSTALNMTSVHVHN